MFRLLLLFTLLSSIGRTQIQDSTFYDDPDQHAELIVKSEAVWFLNQVTNLDTLCFDEPSRFFSETFIEANGRVSYFGIYQRWNGQECLLKSFSVQSAPLFTPAIKNGKPCRQRARSVVNICFTN